MVYTKHLFKVLFLVFLFNIIINNINAQITNEPANSIKFGARQSFSKFLGNVKVDSSFLLPNRAASDTIVSIFRVPGSVFYDNTNKVVRYYNGTNFLPFGQGEAGSTNPWLMGGNTLATVAPANQNDSAVGTINNRGVALLQNNLERLVITPEGYIGINNTKPAFHLDVNGTIQAKAAKLGRLLSGNAPGTSSDVRFKKDIQPLSKSLKKILQIKGVSYFLRNTEFPDRGFVVTKQVGFIAQEIEKIIPELVSTENDGYKSVTYTSFIPYLVEAVKEQNEIIEKLEEQAKEQNEMTEKLEDKTKDQNKMIEKLEDKIEQQERQLQDVLQRLEQVDVLQKSEKKK